MKNLTRVALGVLTSVGGYLEAGSIGTALQAGAAFRFGLLWAIALGTICIAFLIEMTGRLGAVSKHTVTDAMRERFGFTFHVWPMSTQAVVDLLVLASEIAGASLAVSLATGLSMRFWALPVMFLIWIVLWRGSFGVIENGVATLGLVTLSFVVAVALMRPDWAQVARGFIPRVPQSGAPHYLYLAVSILGATISPYLVTFYSSGAVEERWQKKDLPANRFIAAVGMGFGSLVSIAALIAAALVLNPRGIRAQSFQEASTVMNGALGAAWGFRLFCASLFIGCFGAALEVALDLSYLVAQTFGWNWSENQKPAGEARFAATYTMAVLAATVPALVGVDPLRFTMFSMVLTVVALPIVIGPLVVLMNDRGYLESYTNGWIANAAVCLAILLAFALAVLAIPLQIVGS